MIAICASHIPKIHKLKTGQASLDRLLDSGIKTQEISELFGPAGNGKTQIALTLSLQTLLSDTSAHVVYLSTEHYFPIKRFTQMMNESITNIDHSRISTDPIQHMIQPELTHESIKVSNYFQSLDGTIEDKIQLEAVNESIRETNHSQSSNNSTKDTNRITNRMHILNILDATHQLHLIKYNLIHFIKQNKDIKLIVLDSVSGHFRGLLQSHLETSKSVYEMGSSLKKIAYECNVAVVVLNQVSDVFDADYSSEKFKAALGGGWEACVNTKLMVKKSASGKRSVSVCYGPNRAPGSIDFRIGIKGIEEFQEES